MAKDRLVSEPQIPADYKGQVAVLAALTDHAKGGLLEEKDLTDRCAGLQAGTVGKVRAVMAIDDRGAEVVAESSLARFKTDFDRWSATDKDRVPWEEVQRRLLDGGQKLKLAEGLYEGGVMFGVDQAGKILFADGGEDVTDIQETTGKNYPDTYEVVYFRENEKRERVPTGYEMFPFVEPYGKSPEMLAFEKFTGRPFVKSKDGTQYRSSWLTSGEDPGWPRRALFFPDLQAVRVDVDRPRSGDPRRGVRRLLRV